MSTIKWTLIFILFLSIKTVSAIASEIDQEAVSAEEEKKIFPIRIKEIKKSCYEMLRAIDEAENEYNPSNLEICYFDDDVKKVSETTEQVKARKESALALERQIQKGEQAILDQIKASAATSLSAYPFVKSFISRWEQNLKDGNPVWPSDLARTIADELYEQKYYSHSVFMYSIAANSYYNSGDEDLKSGYALVACYNDTVNATNPTKPTSTLFTLILKAISYFEASNNYREVIGSALADEMRKQRDMMVRWPVSPQDLADDSYYPQHTLLKKIYEPYFVERFLNDIKKLAAIFNSNQFCSATQDNDLLKNLIDGGFHCFKNKYKEQTQYVWANKDGYLVRVKRNENNWEYTVGIALINPFQWQNTKAVAVKKFKLGKNQRNQFFTALSQYKDLPSAQYNEIFKIVCDGALVMISPAFCDFYWSVADLEKKQILKAAHHRLKNVGYASNLDKEIGSNTVL